MHYYSIGCILSPAGYEGLQYYGGDIKLTVEQQTTLEALSNPDDKESPQLAVVRSTRSLWPRGKVPFIIHNSLGEVCW